MNRPPARPRLFTDQTIARQILLHYHEDGIDKVKDITGKTLDGDSVAILHNPATKPRVVVKFSPDDPTNTPLVYEYIIDIFLIDYDQYERVVEIRFTPSRAVCHGAVIFFIQAIVQLATVKKDGKIAPYEIGSSAQLNLLTGVITF